MREGMVMASRRITANGGGRQICREPCDKTSDFSLVETCLLQKFGHLALKASTWSLPEELFATSFDEVVDHNPLDVFMACREANVDLSAEDLGCSRCGRVNPLYSACLRS